MPRHQARQLSTVVAVGISGLLVGVLLALGLCREYVIWKAQNRLALYTEVLRRTGEAASSEATNALVAANALSHPFCSDAEITLLRDLAFRSHYLKDVGRVRGGFLVCSGTLGRLEVPAPMPARTLLTRNGLSVYVDIPVAVSSHLRSTVLEAGEANVVLSTDVYRGLVPPPSGYAVFAVDANGRGSRIWGEPLAPGAAEAMEPGIRQISGVLYDSTCSNSASLCAITHIRVQDVLARNRQLFWIFGLAGGLVGLVLAFLGLLAWRGRLSLVNRLRRAIRQDGLTVSYQPIVDLATGNALGAEALVRWRNERGRPVSAEIFVRLAEEKGFIGEITRFVSREVVKDMGAMLLQRPDFRINVNISPADIGNPDLFDDLQRHIALVGIKPSQIGLELTERATAERGLAINMIALLRRRGHVVYIDDFGTGYSSLSYLTELNVDVIKIDRSFTRQVGIGDMPASIVPQIVAMARTLDVGVVVEGIETQAQADYFRALDPAIRGQGRYFAHPMGAREFLLWLDGHHA